jgi:hypothetical protein
MDTEMAWTKERNSDPVDQGGSETFPPSLDHKHEYKALLCLLYSTLGHKKADYVSTPYTGGRRFVEWLLSEGNKLPKDSPEFKNRHYEMVMKPNAASANALVTALRRQNDVVIDPTSFDIPHWTQNDYRHLWGLVIERHVKRAFFMDGWEYSKGCVYEFFIAMKSKIEICDQIGDHISREKGFYKIESAVQNLEALSLPADFFRQVLDAIEQQTRG